MGKVKMLKNKNKVILKMIVSIMVGIAPIWWAIEMFILKTVFLGTFLILGGVVWIWFRVKDGIVAYKNA